MFNIKFIAFALTLGSAVTFFNPKGILGEGLGRMIFSFFALLFIGLSLISGKRVERSAFPRVSYWVVILSIVVSCFVCSATYAQSFTSTLLACSSILMAFLTLWAMFRLQISQRDIIRLLLVCVLIAIPIYFVNAATFPDMLFGGMTEKDEDLSRGMLRVPIYFLEFMVMFLFYSINQWLICKKWNWLGFGVLMLVMIFLSVTRQVILISVVLALIFMLKSARWGTRILVVGVVAGFGLFVLPSIPAYKAMVELSEYQSEKNEVEDEDIRIIDYRYFGDEAQKNLVTRLFGNGYPQLGKSPWGKQLDTEWDNTGTFFADVGWVGFYWLFGAFGTLALLVLLIKAACIPKPPEKRYLTYTIIYFIFVSIASGPILYNYQIFYIMIVLYLIYGPNEKIDNEINSDNYPKLQQRRRLGQLRSEC